MSSTLLHRPARVRPPAVPGGEVVLDPPPVAPERSGGGSWAFLLLPILMVGGSLGIVLYNPSPAFLLIGAVMALGSIAFGVTIVVQQRSGGRRAAERARDRYLAYLDRLASELDATAALQDRAARFTHPGLVELLAVGGERVRTWERALADPDFATVRVGTGPVPLATPPRLNEPQRSLTELDAPALAAARELVARWSVVPDQPVLLDLRANASVSLVGPRDRTRALARAAVMELATLCAPDDLMIVIWRPPAAAAGWEFAKWLPHVVRPDAPALLCEDSDRLAGLLAAELAQRRAPAEPRPHLLLVVDGFRSADPIGRNPVVAALAESGAGLGASAVFLVEARPEEPRTVDLRVHVGGDGRFVPAESGPCLEGVAASADPVLCELIVRRLTPLRLGDRDPRTTLAETWRLADLLQIAGPDDLRPERGWRARPPRELMRAPLGVGADGEPVVLDLKEPAQGGMGPHGLVIGATGSGKSELLRTLTTGLAVSHPPELLAMVLVDFKGGATFAGMADLPQVAGMITNLQADLALVDRVHDALIGEQLRRQELLRRAGNLDSIREYHRRRAEGADLEPMPFLLVIVDEFGELLAGRPDFIDLFVAIGRVGRSLGMHLLLASQRLDEGRLRGLESHLSYRVALRVFSAMESRAIIGVTDAYTLPAAPGSAYLKVDPEAPRRFKVAAASTPHEPPAPVAARPTGPVVRPFTAGALIAAACEPAAPAAAREAGEPDSGAPTTVQVVVGALRGAAPRVHQVWLPPLEPALALDELLPRITLNRERGLMAAGWPGTGQLRVALGLVDRPVEQTKEHLVVDFASGAGHLAIVGAPQSGKSTLLRTLLLSFVLTHTPVEAQFYAIDHGGGGLQALERLPHVGSVCGRSDAERARRVVGELSSLLDRREQFFRSAGIDSIRTFRGLRESDLPQKEVFCDVFLLIDNWGAVHHDLEELEPALLDIASRGPGHGLHLVITANRWMEVRSNLRDSIGGRLELRLNEPLDSELDRKAAARVPAGVPGRGLTAGGHLFQAALPRVDGRASTHGLKAAADEVVVRAAQAWTGPVAPPARVLPLRLPAAALPAPAAGETGIPVGIAEPALAPVAVDLAGGDPHFVVFGDGEAGKTGFCRTFLRGLVARSAPGDVAVAVVDYRRGLLDVVPPDFLLAYAGGAPAVAELVARLDDTLRARLPRADLAPAQLRQRTWWSGPELYLVVDDYDLVVSPAGLNPLLPLLEFLAQGGDLGFHVVAARRSGGAGRALFEPVLQRLRDLGTPGILLSGDRAEGALIGTQAPAPKPPGRGLLVRRQHPPALVQLAWTPPD
jgi:S-DNA-T family DNA segregation ATPase FtsK/SpoIIIE